MATGPVGLSGPGACGVARALVLDFISNASEQAAEVIVAGPAVAELLFPGVEPFVGMEIAGDLEAAITRLEVELVHRTRLIDETDDTDFASYIEQNPVEPLPALVLVAKAVRSGLRLRLDAVASVGGRLGISAVVLDPPSTMGVITIAEGGVVEDVSATPALSDLRGAQLFSLEPVEATELLSVVAAGRGAPEPMEGIAEHRPESFELGDVPAAGPIAVHLLGAYRIEANGEEIRTGFRTKARELLAFLLLHPQGKSVEAAVDAIWPDSDLARGAEGFRTAVGNIRKVVRAATRNPKARVIERIGERYRVEPSMFDCDLWRLEDALRDAKHADRDADVAAALEKATKECAGELLEGSHYEWAETPREDIRRRSLDALAKLADVRADSGDLDAVIAILEDAVRLDPYAEEFYRRVMTTQAQLGHHDAARRTYGQLESRLADLDMDPDESTQRLLDESSPSVRAG
jgi:DNA-binding SARP family transcriptional activator